MRAVAEEYPEITVITYRLFCDLLDASGSHNLPAKLEPHTYGLQPSFVDGWWTSCRPRCAWSRAMKMVTGSTARLNSTARSRGFD